MSGRRPPEISESIAEAIRAGLALIAVVLLARANVGALTKAPSVGVGLPVCLLAWGTAAGAARWSRHSGGSRLCVWRDCVAPALVTLLIAGSGNSGSLTMAIGLVAMGSVAVGLAATCCGTDLGERSGETMEAMATKTNRVDSSSDGPEPMPEREGEAPAEPRRGADVVHGSQPRMSFALPVDAESGHADRSSAGGPPVGECTRPNTPAPDAMAVTPIEDAAPAGLAEIGESSDGESSDDESIPTESWNRTESDGEVSIEAVTHARFDEGSKLAVVHLPFVPPLQAVPQIECEPLDCGCEVTIKTDAVYRHGVRLSVTRQSAGPAESVPIGVMVYTTAEEPVE